MSLKKSVTDQFIYLRYIRKEYKDFSHFKRELENMLSSSVGDRVVVVDFTGSTGITSSEIGLLVRLINKFKGTARFLRIVGTEQITKTLKSTNVHKLENLTIYTDQKEFVEQVKKIAN